MSYIKKKDLEPVFDVFFNPFNLINDLIYLVISIHVCMCARTQLIMSKKSFYWHIRYKFKKTTKKHFQLFFYRTRIVLIGCTGVGKSSVGNTLLGSKIFEESAASKYATSECEISEGTVGTRKIKVVDTPGLISSDGTSMMSILGGFFKCLAPGPHAIIIVISPNRHSEAALKDLRTFFGDDHFLDFTMLIMVKKSDIVGEFGESKDITEFITQKSSENVKQLYRQCKERIVAVENKQKMSERQKEAEKVFEVIDNMDGYYDNHFFKNISEGNVKDKQIAELKEQVKQLELEKNRKRFYFF